MNFIYLTKKTVLFAVSLLSHIYIFVVFIHKFIAKEGKVLRGHDVEGWCQEWYARAILELPLALEAPEALVDE